MYLGDSSLWIFPVEGGNVDTGGHKPHNEIYGENRDGPPLPQGVPVFLPVVEGTEENT